MSKKAEQREALIDELAEIRQSIKELRRERVRETELVEAREAATELEKEIVQLEINRDRLVEDNARALREVEHKVGLERKRQEHEIDVAKRTTELEVREENLDHERDQFSKDMEFQQTHLKGEIERIERILGVVLERLPDVNAQLDIATNRAS